MCWGLLWTPIEISKLSTCSTNVVLTTIFKACLLPYFRLAITSMKWNTLTEHKEAAIICEESGPINLSYNVLLTTPKANIVVKPIVHVVIPNSWT